MTTAFKVLEMLVGVTFLHLPLEKVAAKGVGGVGAVCSEVGDSADQVYLGEEEGVLGCSLTNHFAMHFILRGSERESIEGGWIEGVLACGVDIDNAFDTVQVRFKEGVGCRLQLGAGIFSGVEDEKESQDNHITGRLMRGSLVASVIPVTWQRNWMEIGFNQFVGGPALA